MLLYALSYAISYSPSYTLSHSHTHYHTHSHTHSHIFLITHITISLSFSLSSLSLSLSLPPFQQLVSQVDDAIISALSDCTATCTYAQDLSRLAAVMTFNLLSKHLQVSAAYVTFSIVQFSKVQFSIRCAECLFTHHLFIPILMYSIFHFLFFPYHLSILMFSSFRPHTFLYLLFYFRKNLIFNSPIICVFLPLYLVMFLFF